MVFHGDQEDSWNPKDTKEGVGQMARVRENEALIRGDEGVC